MAYIFTCVLAEGIESGNFKMAINAAIPEIEKELYYYNVTVNFIAPDKIKISSESRNKQIPLSLNQCRKMLSCIFIDNSTGKIYPEFAVIKAEEINC